MEDKGREYETFADCKKCEVNVPENWTGNFLVTDINNEMLCILSSLEEAVSAGNYAMSFDGGYEFVEVTPTQAPITHNNCIEWALS